MVTVAESGARRSLPYRPRQWGVAFKALWTLANDTTRTDQVFTIISALSGDSFEHTYRAFRKSPHGPRLARERSSVMAALSDTDRLRVLAAGTLGREYLRFMEGGKLTAMGLVDAQSNGTDPNRDIELDEERRYVADRLRDMHDVWHVLTDYGCDDTGEIANLWFSVGQFGNPGMAFIALFATLDGQMDVTLSWPRYCLRAYLRGRRAARLVCEPIEEMLALPLEDVRRRLRVKQTQAVHPEGIRYGYRRDRRLGAIAEAA
jgi:ubiquinone biosynthesis protein COQ4